MNIDHHTADQFLKIMGPSAANELLEDEFTHNVWYEETNKLLFYWSDYVFYGDKHGTKELTFSKLKFKRVTWKELTFIAAGYEVNESTFREPLREHMITLGHFGERLERFTKCVDGPVVTVPTGVSLNAYNFKNAVGHSDMELVWADELGTRLNFQFKWNHGTRYLSMPCKCRFDRNLNAKVREQLFLDQPFRISDIMVYHGVSNAN